MTDHNETARFLDEKAVRKAFGHPEWPRGTEIVCFCRRSDSLDNIEQVKGILSFHKEHTQMIAVVHNPLLIYALSKVEHIHFIELTKGYVKKVKMQVNNIVK